jgi:hypothetical protein
MRRHELSDTYALHEHRLEQLTAAAYNASHGEFH